MECRMEMQRNRTINVAGLADLTAAICRLVDLLDATGCHRLGGDQKPLYNTAPPQEAEIVDEVEMAKLIGIPSKTLSNYRRKGKFPGCWHRNGKRILWRVEPTVAAWGRGIP